MSDLQEVKVDFFDTIVELYKQLEKLSELKDCTEELCISQLTEDICTNLYYIRDLISDNRIFGVTCSIYKSAIGLADVALCAGLCSEVVEDVFNLVKIVDIDADYWFKDI